MSNKSLIRTSVWLVFVLAVLYQTTSSLAAPVQCTVGGGGTYLTIQSALTLCNGGVGSIELILNGTFFEDIVFQDTLNNVTLTSLTFSLGNATAWPHPDNITDGIILGNHILQGTNTSLFFQGIAIDGQENGLPFFRFPTINNNITLDRCLVANFSGNYTLQMSPCKRAVTLRSVNSRYRNIWGSALYAEGMEDIDVRSNIFDRCGGLNNQSCTYLKHSFVSEGIYIVSNNSHWLLADLQPDRCVFNADPNGMVRCNNGSLECYDLTETERLRPSCVKVEMEFILDGTNITLIAEDYPLECRVYRECVCQDIIFMNPNTSQTYALPVGDM